MKLTKKMMRKGFTLVELLVVIAIIAVLAGLATPAILKAKKNADKVQTINNAKQIGLAMTDFDSKYDSYPSEDTRIQLEEIGLEVPSGDDANSYLAQLIVSDSTDSEEIFYAKGVKGTKKGDGVKDTRDDILKRGENGFGYVMLSGSQALSSSYSESATPLIVAPLKSGGQNPVFDDNPYSGSYVYLRGDNSVATGDIQKESGKALVKGRGLSGLFDDGPKSVWDDEEPDVKAPMGLD
ncbi:type II secretion system GspH family protein [Akkermansiaceae bacterium]|nr:type II secretion system GspH family protein [Akkermansiaceae bacterium]MDA7916974.1 type II secretion system GspH family protein [Akkermansiaceae bacterium]MDB4271534.1 type II secretion system GspH family protein [Akkermansiaceae bacterium]MDB4283305.1 type II secretion system GspH family protein [Akkermansiaceae bacterium]MDB4781595.1 type II secretion system GspH family protein [Akkermansiaceae bacterium]